uniref:Periplasmic chaperone for outer membrane proteins Skp n=1 Tax=Candidatus Kentrum sp. MB TaxID=2138164 RepID=A0A450X3J4_9GAMM|nr:MAG: periplasmic chaperone for outer membrane proteins Skp [Candidatus Kentron sp. MB]VFK26732.1 MAG: periplasmic chaperone for outer membrane proteins Skp [Candidatus Kentron sp. MB]VFK74610.1 MAG: periplasmic chaperone for outer membrane proteins Skp [Candidatus Kentron sp. MB]
MFKKFAAVVAILLVETWWPSIKAVELRIGYVDTATVMQKAPQAESAVRKIESEFAPRDKVLVEQQKKIARLEKELDREGNVMSNRERRNLIQEVRSLKRERRRLQEEFREEFTMRRNELQGELTLIIIKAIRTIAKVENYDLIIDTAIYAGKRIDITRKVISQLIKEYKNRK